MHDREKGDRNKSVDEMESERALDVEAELRERKPRPLIYALSRLLVTLSYAIVGSLIVSLIAQAFTTSIEAGLKCLAAAALPPLVVTYFALFTDSFRPPRHIPEISLFISAAAWMIAMLLLVNYLYSYATYGIPLGVLALATTLSGLIFLNKHIPFSATLSCSYGIVAGLLLYTLLFGVAFGI
jgi:hypothetical protein